MARGFRERICGRCACRSRSSEDAEAEDAEAEDAEVAEDAETQRNPLCSATSVPSGSHLPDRFFDQPLVVLLRQFPLDDLGRDRHG